MLRHNPLELGLHNLNQLVITTELSFLKLGFRYKMIHPFKQTFSVDTSKRACTYQKRYLENYNVILVTYAHRPVREMLYISAAFRKVFGISHQHGHCDQGVTFNSKFNLIIPVFIMLILKMLHCLRSSQFTKVDNENIKCTFTVLLQNLL